MKPSSHAEDLIGPLVDMTFWKLGRYWRTLGYLRAEQLRYLIWRRLFRQPRRVTKPQAFNPELAAAFGCLLPLRHACWLGARSFRFLNHELDFGDRIDWQASGESRLWRYNLHYFDWLRQPDCDPGQALGQMQDWITANPPFAGTGWEPYPSSLRLVNWMGTLGALPTSGVPRAVIDSVALQSSWLAGNIEYQLGANHLFVNLKALLFAAAFLDGDYGRELARPVGKRFERELIEQFLADGGHYERSPMYHAILTQDLLELTALCARNSSLLPVATAQTLRRTTEKALAFAAVTQPPDDGVFLFNDSAPNIAPACSCPTASNITRRNMRAAQSRATSPLRMIGRVGTRICANLI